MKPELLELLRGPIDCSALTLQNPQYDRDEIMAGELIDRSGNGYPIENGIPRLIIDDEREQQQTADSFGYKWGQRDTYESESFIRFRTHWFLERYGFSSEEAMLQFFEHYPRIFDAGCGSGTTALLFMRPRSTFTWYGLEISSAIDVAKTKLADFANTHFIQGNMLHAPFAPNCFDLILAHGTLHHTRSTREALHHLSSFLRPGGQFLFYVYRKKGPIREFADDYIREQIRDLPAQGAWEALRPLTQLGKTLAELKTNVTIEEDIPMLGIPKGTFDIQRFLYWNFIKMFWNESLSFEENLHVNFDWYHPHYAHRQTEEEIRAWCDECQLEITYLREEESGFSVRAKKRDH